MNFSINAEQEKIIRDYWETRLPFTASDLVEKGLTKSQKTGEKTLRKLEKKGQVLPVGARGREILYRGATNSLREYNDLVDLKYSSKPIFPTFGGPYPIDDEERAEMLEILERLKADFHNDTKSPA